MYVYIYMYVISVCDPHQCSSTDNFDVLSLSPLLQDSLLVTSPPLWLVYPGGKLVNAYLAFLDPNVMKYHHNV